MAFKFLQNPSILALILALLFAHEIQYTAFAASVGRMGGSCFASEKESYLSSESYNNNPRFISGYVDRAVGIYLSIAYLNRASVLRVQVALSGMAHSVQRELSTLAIAGDASKTKTFHFFLTESAVALLRHQCYWTSGYSSAKRSWNLEAVEKEFRQLSTNERLKYDIESLVNVDNMKVQRTFIPRDNKVEKNCILVTILVAVKGALNLPEIKSTEDLRTALHYLNTISSRNTLAVEVLWSPQEEHDTLSQDELLENYPLLRAICSEVCMALSSSNSYDVYHYHYGKPGYSRGFESYDDNSQRVNAGPKRENNMNKSDKGFFLWFALLPFGIFGGFLLWMVCTTAASVVKIQVGLSGKAHSLQRDLNNLAGAGDTSEKKLFHIILIDSILALLRHQNYWVYGYSSVKQKRGVEAMEKEFRQLLAEEREKVKIEPLVQRTLTPKDNKLRKDYIVVTLMVAVKGAPNLPAIRSTEDLRKALRHLNSITSREILNAKVLWTPQAEHDTLSEDELLEKYLILRPI